MAEVGGAIVGAVIGLAVTGGNPMGALYGAQMGMTAGAILFAEDQIIPGPKIGEIQTQYSRENVPRPIVFGVCRPIGGNIIYAGAPRIVERKKKVGGKGGGDQYQTYEEVYRTYAIRICEGPITAIRRVWRNNELIFDSGHTFHFGPLGELVSDTWHKEPDSRSSDDPQKEFMKYASFYNGSFDQMPSPALQAKFGVDKVTAHRGTAYLVMEEEDLTDLRGAIPQYLFEVERNEGFVLTTRPYPIESAEAVSVGLQVTSLTLQAISGVDALDSPAPTFTSISNLETGLEHPEIEATSPELLVFNSLTPVEIPYTSVDEAVDYLAAVPTAISIETKRFDYELADGLERSLTVTSITLEPA